MNKFNHFISTIAGATLVAAVSAGCADRPGAHNEGFENENALTRPVHAAELVQAARGARKDAMLRPVHFDNGSLNSLGRDKLDLMVKDNERGFPIVVYLDLSKDAPSSPARRSAVDAWFKDAGLTAAQYQVEFGPNPDSLHSVQGDVTALSKIDAGGPLGGEGASTMSGTGGFGAGAASGSSAK